MEAIMTFFAVNFDLPILECIQAHLQCGVLDFLMPIITLFGEGGIFWIAWPVVLLFIPKYRKVGWSMGAALVLGLIICNVILKNLIGRDRPFFFYTVERMANYDLPQLKNWVPVTENDIKWLVASDLHKSFPSGHTIASFEACTVLMLHDKRLGIPATVLAILIAFSRLYLYVHYPTDVLVSVVLGILFGILGNLIVNAIYKKFVYKGKYIEE